MTGKPRGSKHPATWLTMAAIATLALLLPSASMASSHREAPLISSDPEADNTDTYSSWIRTRRQGDPLGNWTRWDRPADRTFSHFGENPLRVKLEWEGRGRGVVYRISSRGRRHTGHLARRTARALAQRSQPNVYYTYKVEKIFGPSPNQGAAAKIELGNQLLEAPNNVGPKSFPGDPAGSGYGKGSRIAETVYTIDQDTKVFAGPRADGFYADLGMIFDLINFRPGTLPGNQGGGKNDLAGFNTHTIALSVPAYQLTKNHTFPTDPSDPNAIISMWSSTWRLKNRVLSSTGDKPTESGEWVQVSRLAVPLVNEVVIPLAGKDVFNASFPKDDAQFATSCGSGGAQDPEACSTDSPLPRTDLLAVRSLRRRLTPATGEGLSDQLAASFSDPLARHPHGVLEGHGRLPERTPPTTTSSTSRSRSWRGSRQVHSRRTTLSRGVDDRTRFTRIPYLATRLGLRHSHDNAPTFSLRRRQPIRVRRNACPVPASRLPGLFFEGLLDGADL